MDTWASYGRSQCPQTIRIRAYAHICGSDTPGGFHRAPWAPWAPWVPWAPWPESPGPGLAPGGIGDLDDFLALMMASVFGDGGGITTPVVCTLYGKGTASGAPRMMCCISCAATEVHANVPYSPYAVHHNRGTALLFGPHTDQIARAALTKSAEPKTAGLGIILTPIRSQRRCRHRRLQEQPNDNNNNSSSSSSSSSSHNYNSPNVISSSIIRNNSSNMNTSSSNGSSKTITRTEGEHPAPKPSPRPQALPHLTPMS